MRRISHSMLRFRVNDSVEISPLFVPNHVDVVSRRLFDSEHIVIDDCVIAVEEGAIGPGHNVTYAAPPQTQTAGGRTFQQPTVTPSITDLMRQEAALLRAEEEVDVLPLADPNEETKDRFAPVRVIEI